MRLYRKEQRTYTNRSTGTEDLDKARAWVLSNMASLFTEKAEQRGGGANSIQRLLVEHIEHQRKRHKAGEISEATLVVYERQTAHFIKWFTANKFKRLADIKRTSLMSYALDRVNKDGYSLNTANLQVVYLKMWWTWLMDTEVVTRPITINKLKPAIENRVSGEPFAPGDLEKIYHHLDELVSTKSEKKDIGNNLTTRSVGFYNRRLFQLFLQLLDESGCRQHEVLQMTWKDVSVKQTLSNRERVINEIRVPHTAKRGFRVQIFMGKSLLNLKKHQEEHCPNAQPEDYLFRHHQTNTLIDRSTFNRYWTSLLEKANCSYKLHTFRSYRITELILSGVEPELVARNLGLSVSQILKTYLRFVPAGHFDQLVMKEKRSTKELRTLLASNKLV